MPGKVNPVIREVVLQVCAQVIGNDAAITVAGTQGNFELNVRVPLIARNLLDQIKLLSSASTLFAEKCIEGIEVNREMTQRHAEANLITVHGAQPAHRLRPHRRDREGGGGVRQDMGARSRARRAWTRRSSTRRSTSRRWRRGTWASRGPRQGTKTPCVRKRVLSPEACRRRRPDPPSSTCTVSHAPRSSASALGDACRGGARRRSCDRLHVAPTFGSAVATHGTVARRTVDDDGRRAGATRMRSVRPCRCMRMVVLADSSTRVVGQRPLAR